MNVIISNKYSATLQDLNIDIIKSETGVFSADEIVAKYQNFFFQRMILDITALQDYQDIKNLQKLSISLDMDKLILLLDDTEETSRPEFLSQLISIGIYNFTKNVEGIMYLYNNPNSYRDVAHIQQLDFGNSENVVIEKYETTVSGTRIIGVKNVTKNSGATTLTYMMRNQLSHNYSVVAIEVNKTDFKYFNDKKLVSTTSAEIGNVVARYNDKDVILIDINDSVQAEQICNDVIYLVEPSIIKLNRLMIFNNRAFSNLKNKKIILNQSVLNSKDVLDFEYEAGVKVFYNMPPLDEREKSIHSLNSFLCRLGFIKQQNDMEEKKNKFLGLFGK